MRFTPARQLQTLFVLNEAGRIISTREPNPSPGPRFALIRGARQLPERAPILPVAEGDHAVSVCFCARPSDVAAEAGVETAAPFRGRGLAPRVTAAWALAIRTGGRLPLYSTSWGNERSLAVARKLGLEVCASDWSLSE